MGGNGAMCILIILPHLHSTLVKDGLIPATEMYKYT